MATQLTSTRQRLIDAALQLFSIQGITETTTRQIAELAQVNEVTLFRHFGNKQGLLLAAISESAVFKDFGESLREKASQTSSLHQALKDYASDRLQALEQVPELVLSVVGESRRYSSEHQQVIGEYLTQANQYVAEYIATVIEREQLQTNLPVSQLASLLNSLLLGYAAIQFTTGFQALWQSRDEFLESLVELFLNQVEAESSVEKIIDLPANLVHLILQKAKKIELRDYALMYVLFATGLSALEIANLERVHQIIDRDRYLLQITQGSVRQVPVNQWILGKRYGSYTRNPLTQWLKSRKDNEAALFLNDAGLPLSEIEIQQRWQIITQGLLTPEGQAPVIVQTQQTWCVEMLMKGMTLENLSMLTGQSLKQLKPYIQRVKEKIAIEQAIQRDRDSQ
ncbi:TetR family transcriptional regulator [Chroococcidiopsis sp. CCALA 051]|uniref:TetR family transcriptional regulator n=1 Tax=Chroococcidiopsis sp. CCALA 051 TaxID=869949 RepID=UPI000D0D9E09|nr:TetR family transcriptional regulator [Chroococcidiopsis sp. CCALA 051]MBE9016776.1 TetR family transcriptional regulator [Chroococcidiopsidales cyanobacterium LEGE 13417]PSM47333.1 TetR family transcriptional regulator [Chroococcidiopsis sp. CCALA 051]